MMQTDEYEPVADALFAALEEGSTEDVLACYAPDARIWHNFDQQTLTREQSLDGVKQLFTGFPRRRYENVRRLPTPNGFIQQHILALERSDGTRIDWPGCIICEVAGGKITLLEEYVDLASLGK